MSGGNTKIITEIRTMIEEEFDSYPREYKPSPPPYIIYGTSKRKIIKVRLGRKQTIKVRTDKTGRWVFDLNNFENGYKGYKYLYVNEKRYKIDNKGKQEVS